MTETTTEQELVTRTVADGVAVLTWNRPERNNAYTFPMEAQYFRLLEECRDDESVRVIVLTGAGRSFCPGLDTVLMGELASTPTATQPHLRAPITLPRSDSPNRSSRRSTARAQASGWLRL